MMSDSSGGQVSSLPDAPGPFQVYVKLRSRGDFEGERVDLAVFEVTQVDIDISLGMMSFEFANGNKYHYPFEQYEQIFLRRGDAPSNDGH